MQSYIAARRLFAKSDELLVAVSGGVDSMTLTHLLKTAGYSLQVAHVNFQLRGEASDGDEEFIRAYCRDSQLPFHTIKMNAGEYAAEHGLSIQMAARDLRYEWFGKIMPEVGCQYLLTAHNADDSVETALFNLVKGTGVSGVAGIKAKTGAYRRPLLFATKEEVLAYATSQGITWREDQSNADTKYIRNQLRHQVLPLLKEINPSLVSHFVDTQDRLAGVEQLLDFAVEDIKSRYLERSASNCQLGLDWVANDERSLVILSVILEEFGCSFRQSRQVFDMLSGQPGKVVTSRTHTINLDRNQLVICKFTAKHDPSEQVQIIVGQSLARLGGIQLSLKDVDEAPTKWRDIDDNQGYFDLDRLRFPLTLRRWRPGDSFQPLGMNGRKKVSDFLIDRRIPICEKDRVFVLTSGEEIVWLVGHQLDDRYKITPSTKRLINISYSAV